MSLLIPLGLIGLIGVGILLVIYFIKPNYQQKFVSSTFVWKLSLKYKKKRIPISKLRNLLILLCQIIILAILALLIAQPVILNKTSIRDNEKVAVIDASASMLATTQYDHDKYTRFEEAVDGVITLAENTLRKDGTLTVILAGAKAEALFTRVGSDSLDEVLSKLNQLRYEYDEDSDKPAYCTYGNADIAGAMTIAESVTTVNPLAEVILYTGKHYLNNAGVTVVDVSRGSEEVNVAILDVRAVLEEGFYTFYADVASYGENSEITLSWYIDVDVYSTGGGSEYREPVTETITKTLRANEVTTIAFDTNSAKKPNGDPRPVTDNVSEYVSATATVIVEGDAIAEDNQITLYGGVKPTLRIEYVSTEYTKFFSTALLSLQDAVRGRYEIEIYEARGSNAPPLFEGFDWYIFEHAAPSELPTDGAVFIVNPAVLPSDWGILLGSTIHGKEFRLSSPDANPLVNYMNLGNLIVTSYRPIATYPEGYSTIMQCDGRPVFIAKNTPNEKVAIMTYDIHYSDIAMKVEFPILLYNMFQHYLPSTFTGFVFDVNESIVLNSRGASIKLEGVNNNVSDELTSFPTEYKLTQVGGYSTTQMLFGSNKTIKEYFFVKMPSNESNIFEVIDVMPGSVVKPVPELSFDDLLVYFAAALVVILLLEWWLQSRSAV